MFGQLLLSRVGHKYKVLRQKKSAKRNRKYGAIIFNVTTFYLLVQLIQICFLVWGRGVMLMLLSPHSPCFNNMQYYAKIKN